MERRKMSISCIIPFFNRSEKVLRCLNSINGIDIPDIEFLLIDDGSNESESNIIRSEIKRDQRIKYKKIVKQGVSAARNIGLQSASKKWIIFIDSDDQIDAGEFNSIVRTINDETDVYILGFTKKMSPDNNIEEVNFQNMSCSTQQLLEKELKQNFNRYIFNPIWNKIYLNTVTKKIRFDESFSYGEDLLFNLNIFKVTHSIKFLSSKYYQYNIEPNSSISSCFYPEITKETIEINEKIIELFEYYGLQKNCRDNIIEMLHNTEKRVVQHKKKYILDPKQLTNELNKDKKAFKAIYDKIAP